MNNAESLQTNVVDAYEEQGYVIIPDVVDPDLVAEMQAHVEWIEGKYPNRRAAEIDHLLVKDDPFWLWLAGDKRLLDIAEQFIGPDIVLFASTYFSKPPFTGEPVLWHQDGVYWPLEPMKVITLWLAVTDSKPENGCLRVIPGTHKLDLKEFHVNKDFPNALESQIDPKHVDESKSVDLILNPGSVSIHHPNIIHGSLANTSSIRRTGLTLRYIPATTRIKLEPWECTFLLRGNAIPGINSYMTYPSYREGDHFPFRGNEA